ncbi:Thioredoxin [Burkholderiales bacterium JOSHI_001]|nr:Thioredoxin [Burkholderiales bacterium JOSHI_001]
MWAMLHATVHIACLCAAWCRTCDAYAPVLQQVAAQLVADGLRLQVSWIDIEDEAELMGDLDVETFPTLVVADAKQVRFAGPVTPEPDTLLRLLRALVVQAAPGEIWPAVPAAVEQFAGRLRQRVAPA